MSLFFGTLHHNEEDTMSKNKLPDAPPSCPRCGSPEFLPMKSSAYPQAGHYKCGSGILNDGQFQGTNQCKLIHICHRSQDEGWIDEVRMEFIELKSKIWSA